MAIFMRMSTCSNRQDLLLRESHKVCKLNKAIDGLKQSPRAWVDKFSTIMLDFGFARCVLDYSMFVRRAKRGCIILIVCVDIVHTGSDIISIHETKG